MSQNGSGKGSRLHPDDKSHSFIARWNLLIKALLVESSIKLVARTAVEYAVRDGIGVYPGNGRLGRETGLSERTVRTAWAALRHLGLAERTQDSTWNGERRTADTYDLVIPPGWRGFAYYGPNFKPFTCAYCHQRFTPPAVYGADKAGRAGWFTDRAVFCPPPRKHEGVQPPGCYTLWMRHRRSQSLSGWEQIPVAEKWEMIAKARDDEWWEVPHDAVGSTWP